MRGLIGKKLSHSYSKLIHETIDNITYNLIELDKLDSFFQEKKFDAINVTIPYKQEVIQYLDELSEEASIIGTVNTIVNKNGYLIGYNTDYFGLEFLLEYNNISLESKVIGILGNGSTMRTIQYISRIKNARKIIVFARNPKQNQCHFSDEKDLKQVDILFNATPNGMFPNNNDDILVDITHMPNLSSVIDLVYNPLRSNLILAAQENKIKAVNGFIMLVHQAVKANELFNNCRYNNDLTISIYKDLYKKLLNIVLIGMPMSGKSYYAKQISHTYKKDLLDIDSLIENEYNMTISEIFKSFGESKFRELETQTTMKYSKAVNSAISTGGGVILNKRNITYLKQNGIIIFLDAPLELLKQCNPKGRPLLKNQDNLDRLYKERYNLYISQCDKKVVKRGFKRKETLLKIEVKVNEFINS